MRKRFFQALLIHRCVQILGSKNDSCKLSGDANSTHNEYMSIVRMVKGIGELKDGGGGGGGATYVFMVSST